MSRVPQLYRLILRLYPRAYRERFGEEMAHVAGDMLEAAPNGAARLAIWMRIGRELPMSLINQHVQDATLAWRDETPGYLKGGGLMAGALLLPFLAALMANGVAVAIRGQNLYHSWLWSTPAIQLWAVWLPAAAIVIACAGWVVYAMRGSAHGRLARAFDVRHAWPVLVTGALAGAIILMLLFHDSVHCWVGNPIYTATHLHQVWQCSGRGFLGG